MRRIPIALVIVVWATTVGVAHADDKAAAESLFVKAKKLMKQGKTAEACDAYAKSQQLDPQFGTQYNLALCEEELGKLASAWVIYRELAQRDTNAKRQKDSTKRADDLEDRIAKLLITMSGNVRGLKVTRDDQDVTNLVGVEDPVDPGTYHIAATAPGYQPWQSDVAVSGEGAVITVQIPTLTKEGAVTTHEDLPPVHTKQGEPVAVRTELPPEQGKSGGGRKMLGLSLAGAGVIATGVGLYFGSVASSKWSDVQDVCPDQACANQADFDRGQGLVADARSAGNLSTILVGAGVAVAATGVVLWLTAPKGEHRDETALRVSPAGAGVAITGGF